MNTTKPEIAHITGGVKFAAFTPEEEEAVKVIIDRMIGQGFITVDPMDIHMDLSATHYNCPLDLIKMSQADDFNMIHDVTGIARHLNRKTGELENCFLPRCAKQ